MTYATFEDRALHWIVDHARIAFAIGLLLVGLAAVGYSQLHLRNDYRAFFSAGDKLVARNDWLASRMGNSRESAVVLYLPSNGNVFESLSLAQYQELGNRALSLPHVVKARSLFDLEKLVILNGNGKLASVPVARGADLYSPEGLQQFSADLKALPAIDGRYVARDRKSALVVLQLDLEQGALTRHEKLGEIANAVTELERDLRKAVPNDKLYLVGSTMFDYNSTQVLKRDVKRLLPLAIAITFVILWAIYRRLAPAFLSVLAAFFPVVATGGVAAWLGFEFSTLSMSSLMLVGTLAVADILHLANSYLMFNGEGGRREAAYYALSKNFRAFVAVSFTTSIGALALLFSASPPVRAMGMILMLGALIVLILAILTMPFLLRLMVTGGRQDVRKVGQYMGKLAEWSALNSSKVIALTGLISAVALAGLIQNRPGDSMSAWFSKRTEFRQGMDLLNQGYMGLNSITLTMRTKETDRDEVYQLPDVGPSLGEYRQLSDTLKSRVRGDWLSITSSRDSWAARANDSKASGFRLDPATLGEAPPPSARSLSEAGLLTQFEPGKQDWAVSYYDPGIVSSFELRDKASAIASVAKTEVVERAPEVLGIPLAFANLSLENFDGILLGTAITYLIITFCLVTAFGSWRLGLLSLIPNTAPILAIYAYWGWADGTINMAAIGVFSVAEGIVVDDTIHLVMRYRNMKAKGQTGARAIAESFQDVGGGVLATTLILTTGFLLLGQSDFLLTAQKASMVGATISVALLFDLLVLPAILVKFDR